MKARPKKLLLASLGVAAVAYGCRRERFVGNLMPPTNPDAEVAVGNLMPAPTEDAQLGPPPPSRQVTDAGRDSKK